MSAQLPKAEPPWAARAGRHPSASDAEAAAEEPAEGDAAPVDVIEEATAVSDVPKNLETDIDPSADEVFPRPTMATKRISPLGR